MAEQATQNDHVLKVLVLGDAATGKTSIIKRYVHNFFNGHHKTTVGVDFHLKQIKIGELSVRLQLWDIAGQDRFGAIARVYYKDALGALLVYDLSRRATFENVTKWKDEIDAKVLLPNGMPLPVVLLGNKCDLEDVQASPEEMDQFVKEKTFVKFFETSALNGKNIDAAARFLVEKILEHDDIFSKKTPKPQDIVQPGLPGAKSQKAAGGCC